MRRSIAITIPLLIGVAAREAPAEDPSQLTIAMYAPSLGFSQARERIQYLESLAEEVERATGIRTEIKAYSRYGDLTSAKPDFAVIEGLCIAARTPGTPLATAVVDGGTERTWGVFARSATTVKSSKGGKLVHLATGCRDADFIDNVVFRGHLRSKTYFGSLITRPDILGVVATARDYQEADLAIAPAGVATSMTEVLSVGSVPNPGFVQLNKRLGEELVASVTTVVRGHSGGAIEGWRAPESYSGFAKRLGGVRIQMVLATAVVEIDLEARAIASPPAGKFVLSPLRTMWWTPRRRTRVEPARAE